MPDLVNVDRLNAKNLTLNMAIFITSASAGGGTMEHRHEDLLCVSGRSLEQGPWVYAVVTAFAFTAGCRTFLAQVSIAKPWSPRPCDRVW